MSTEVQESAQILSKQEVLAWFRSWGYSVTKWAHSHGLSDSIVRAILDEKKTAIKGLRGDAHRAMVLLNLKTGSVEVRDGAMARPSKLQQGEA